MDINKINMYKKINIDDSFELLFNSNSFDSYCNKCKSKSTFILDKEMEKDIKRVNMLLYCAYTPGKFKSKEDINKEWFEENNNRIIQFKFDCARNNSHNIFYTFLITTNGLIKIGQYPSDRDLIDNNFSKRIKNLTNNDGKEINDYLNKSIILNSEGYGVASTLYLRRAFEYIVNLTLDYDTSERIPMDKKINDSDCLPKEFKENKRIYNILSDGVHNLSDEECNSIFNAMYEGVVILLEEYFYQIERKNRLKFLSTELNNINK
jgi:hypothetical protein